MKNIVLSISLGVSLMAACGSHANEANSFRIAAGNCTQKANQIAAGYPGGQVQSISQSVASGKTTCVIVIRVPGNNGKQPRIIRKTVSG